MPHYLGTDTWLQAIARGWGIRIYCRSCTAETRWTDADLEERFGDRLEDQMADIVPRLVCSKCDGRDLVVHPYQAGVRDTGHRAGWTVDEMERELRGRKR